jgi:hypothetical protein
MPVLELTKLDFSRELVSRGAEFFEPAGECSIPVASTIQETAK